jgi:hypothetical protein
MLKWGWQEDREIVVNWGGRRGRGKRERERERERERGEGE